MTFKLHSNFKPSGDQPNAIESITEKLNNHINHQILLGVTGSGKTYTMANVIAKLNRPTLVLAHNKTLAAQLCSEFKEFFPENAVEYFVSYYDYYQPEAYIAARDVYIEKEADINQEIERLRHSATRSLMLRRDVIIVASVSCIYGLGIPEDYIKGVINISIGKNYPRNKLLLNLQASQYERNDIELKQGRYRIKGDTLTLFPSWEENHIKCEFFGDECEAITVCHPVTGNKIEAMDSIDIFPATHYLVHENKERAITAILNELKQRESELIKQEKPIEAHRLKSRTLYDIDMLQEVGYCKGIENYSRHLSNRSPGEPGGVLIDFFPDDFITIIDESHATMPQIRGMYNGDQSRKSTLIDYGFRLPSAKDNRPLTFEEFNQRVKQCIYVSATPGPYELDLCQTHLTEQIIRPTGLIDPQIKIKETKGQIDDLLSEINKRIQKGHRILITAITKQLSEDLSNFLAQNNIKVQYLHSDIKTLDRIDILHDLRKGKYDVLVGVNLLREGLDLPEVSLVAILDADKEGFLRNERSLIQTMGRAARHNEGTVILYADKITDSMKRAINETNRRRTLQLDYNKTHNISPKSIIKKISDIRGETRKELLSLEKQIKHVSPGKLPDLIKKLEKDMKEAAKELQFELAAVLRDQIETLKNSPIK